MDHFTAEQARILANRSAGAVEKELERVYEQVREAANDGRRTILFQMRSGSPLELSNKVSEELVLRQYKVKVNQNHMMLTITW